VVTILWKVAVALFLVIYNIYQQGLKKNDEVLEETQPVFGPRFETWTSNIKAQSYTESYVLNNFFKIWWL
jgi:hypothetical protein